ncbi:MAG TPA: FMN-binding negative transcriptional regulator, partial [Gammaproteobacteria bacterium]|nr:FMN-binding negative transcriptional regulator [Gammaproteobacteria bacterium]
WLRTQLAALTSHSEAAFAEPWKITDAPQDFTDKLIGSIVGIEIVITRLQGKWKLSQNQPEQNRQGVIQGLESVGTQQTLDMAKAVAEASKEIT